MQAMVITASMSLIACGTSDVPSLSQQAFGGADSDYVLSSAEYVAARSLLASQGVASSTLVAFDRLGQSLVQKAGSDFCRARVFAANNTDAGTIYANTLRQNPDATEANVLHLLLIASAAATFMCFDLLL